MSQCIEIRSYALRPGMRAEFHRLMTEEIGPMFARWLVDVVLCGPSIHDADSYVLMRRYASASERVASQDVFYGSREWIEGPREAIMACIDSYVSVVLNASDAVVEMLRTQLDVAGRP